MQIKKIYRFHFQADKSYVLPSYELSHQITNGFCSNALYNSLFSPEVKQSAVMGIYWWLFWSWFISCLLLWLTDNSFFFSFFCICIGASLNFKFSVFTYCIVAPPSSLFSSCATPACPSGLLISGRNFSEKKNGGGSQRPRDFLGAWRCETTISFATFITAPNLTQPYTPPSCLRRQLPPVT